MELLADEPRRSERTKRDKPDFYDASEYENKRLKSAAGNAASPSAAATAAASGARAPKRSSAATQQHSPRPRLGRPPRQTTGYSDSNEEGEGGSRRGHSRTAAAASGKTGRRQNTARATMTWKKDYSENESDDGYKKKRKKKRAKGSAAQQPQQQPQLECNEESEGEQLEADQQGDLVDYLPPLRALHCKIFLSEINRRLGAVMHQPG